MNECRDDIIDLHTTCWHYVILVDESIVFAPLKATFHSVFTGADAYVEACFTVVTYPWLYGRLKQTCRRICIIILLISAHPLPRYITPWEERMTSGDVLCFAIRAVRFRRANDHFSFGGVRRRLGRKSWVAAARVACAEAVWDSKLYASKLYQRKTKYIKLSYIN